MFSIQITVGDFQGSKWITNVIALVTNELLEYFSRNPSLVSFVPLNLTRLISHYEKAYLIDQSTILAKVISLIDKDFTLELTLKISRRFLMKKRLFRSSVVDEKAVQKLGRETYLLQQKLNELFPQFKPIVHVSGGLYDATFT